MGDILTGALLRIIVTSCDRASNSLTPPSASGTQEPPIPMTLHPRPVRFRPSCLMLVSALSCGGRVQSAGTEQPVTIRLSTGFPTGNFRPFSEALVKGYARLMPDVRVQQVDTRGSLGNIEALQDGTVDIGLAQAGIAYMAYNGRLRESGRAMRGLRGIAILNSSAVHLMVGPGSPIRSMDELRGRRVGVGPDGSGAAVTSQAVLHGYFSPGDVHEVDASVPQTNAMLLDNDSRRGLHDFERSERRREDT